jgi:hypothetical protein
LPTPDGHHVLSALDKGESGQFVDLLPRRAAGKGEVISVERLHSRKARHAREHLPRPGASGVALAAQQLLQERGK